MTLLVLGDLREVWLEASSKEPELAQLAEKARANEQKGRLRSDPLRRFSTN